MSSTILPVTIRMLSFNTSAHRNNSVLASYIIDTVYHSSVVQVVDIPFNSTVLEYTIRYPHTYTNSNNSNHNQSAISIHHCVHRSIQRIHCTSPISKLQLSKNFPSQLPIVPAEARNIACTVVNKGKTTSPQ